MATIKDKSSALLLFEDSAKEQELATELGDYKKGNKNYFNIVKAINALKEQGELLALLDFLNHPSIGVRGLAACYLLPVRENEAIEALELISQQTGIHALTARTTLSEWRNGNLKF